MTLYLDRVRKNESYQLPQQTVERLIRQVRRTSAFFLLSAMMISCGSSNGEEIAGEGQDSLPVIKTESKEPVVALPAPATLDSAWYDRLSVHLANGDSSGRWPVKGPYPLPGAVLPFKRVIAFYGNLYSKQMGILGELPRKEMLRKLQDEVAQWQAADTTLKVVPALHYIAVTAQGSPGKAGKYRLRMPFHQIDSVLSMAKEINALVFLDVQVGLGTIKEELPEFEKYLRMPEVHFGIDPEFSMKSGAQPGKAIGTFDAADINYVTGYLADLVREYNLPPKMLVVHRFTQAMVTNYKQITLRPEVQIIMDMDGWGHQARKKNTYRLFVQREPVQFTGFKLFYKNDLREPGSHLMTPAEVLQLQPQPVYIQYQ